MLGYKPLKGKEWYLGDTRINADNFSLRQRDNGVVVGYACIVQFGLFCMCYKEKKVSNVLGDCTREERIKPTFIPKFQHIGISSDQHICFKKITLKREITPPIFKEQKQAKRGATHKKCRGRT